MDVNNIFNSKSGNNCSHSNSNSNSNNPISSLVLDHLFSSSSSSASHISSQIGSINHHRYSSRPMGIETAALVRPNLSPEIAVESYDCESEEGIEAVEEPVRPPGHRSSGSKRSRAAEVHNQSEKRRRSRINEKMKALQSLIPNSNKTDKASMLDEAIEYLKQLQLQVQILSMRNGLSLSSAFLPGDFSALQASEMRLGYGVESRSLMNMDIKDPMLTFATDSSLAQSSHIQHESFNLPATAEELYIKDMTSRQELDAFHMTRPEESQMKQLGATVSHGLSSNSKADCEQRNYEK